MAYRDIVVHVDATPASYLRSQAAAEIAARFKAHLTGVFLAHETAMIPVDGDIYGPLPPELVAVLQNEHAKALDKASTAARQRFETAANEAAVTPAWKIVDAVTPDAMIDHARRADLTIFPVQAVPCLGQNHIAAARLALASGGPVLVTPEDGYAPPVGRRVLVAWDGGREASRVLRDAWPFLETAEEISVLTVGPVESDDLSNVLRSHFERHGCHANFIADARREDSAGDILDPHIVELDIDLVVMGLYGHSRLQELVLGGVSRHMLRQCRAPLLISH